MGATYTQVQLDYSQDFTVIKYWLSRSLLSSTRQLFSDLGQRLIETSGESSETNLLFGRCSAVGTVFLHISLPAHDCTD